VRKLIAGMKISVDGKFEGPEGYAGWVHAWSEDYGLTPQIDACLLGGGMYPGYENYWQGAHRRRLRSNGLALQQSKDIYLVGGARTTASLIEAGLVDELRLIAYPLIAGGGKALFATGRRHALQLHKVQPLLDSRSG
jgi:RibD C-terminal domain